MCILIKCASHKGAAEVSLQKKKEKVDLSSIMSIFGIKGLLLYLVL
jgi:hypothetical protein